MTTSVFSCGHFRFRPLAICHVILHVLGATPVQRSYAIQVVRTAWYIVICFGIVTGGRDSGRSPSYRSMDCRWDMDCRTDLGEVCYKQYEGCSQGMCMCDPSSHIRDSLGRCRPVRRGADSCGSGDECPDGMTCRHRTCKCFVGEMTIDRDYCLRANEKLLGQSCIRQRDVCVQRKTSGYVHDEVYCSELGICECAAGLQSRGNSCHRHSIGEHGCVKDHHCDGGSVCVKGYCKCPPGRVPIAGKTKCGRTGALNGLPLSVPCDEIGEKRYCDQGLVCDSCGTDGLNICVRSRLPPYQSPLYAHQGACSLSPHSALPVAALLLYILSVRWSVS